MPICVRARPDNRSTTVRPAASGGQRRVVGRGRRRPHSLRPRAASSCCLRLARSRSTGHRRPPRCYALPVRVPHESRTLLQPVEVSGGRTGRFVEAEAGAEFPPSGFCDPDRTLWQPPNRVSGRRSSCTQNGHRPQDPRYLAEQIFRRIHCSDCAAVTMSTEAGARPVDIRRTTEIARIGRSRLLAYSRIASFGSTPITSSARSAQGRVDKPVPDPDRPQVADARRQLRAEGGPAAPTALGVCTGRSARRSPFADTPTARAAPAAPHPQEQTYCQPMRAAERPRPVPPCPSVF